MTATVCPQCGGQNGQHGLVHSRYGNGGGGNRPCPVGERAKSRAEERPYVVLYRAARPTKRDPDRIVKGRRTFRTRTEMNRFISTAPDNYAITYYS